MPPWLILAGLLALAFALLFQLITRRTGWRVLPYWFVTLCGLLLAEIAAESLGLNLTRFGDLRLLPDAVGAFAILSVLWFFGL